MAISYRSVTHLVHFCIRLKNDKFIINNYFLIETKLVTTGIKEVSHFESN